MAGVRNFHRYCWLLFYLFGASPAACRSFFAQQDTSSLTQFGTHTLYGVHATSMRMSNIGYRNPVQSEIRIDHNTVAGYTESLRMNTKTPYRQYVDYGIKRDGEYVQLNPNLLQIENEFYSVIRPKRTIRPLEAPTNALRDRGVEYLELRCLDLDPHSPIGITASQAHFIELFVVYCLLRPSPQYASDYPKAIATNKDTAVLAGRAPGQTLNRNGNQQKLTTWGRLLLEGIEAVAETFDSTMGVESYRQSVQTQRDALNDSQLTPSARILSELQSNNEPFFTYAIRKANDAKASFESKEISCERMKYYDDMAIESLSRQQAMEQADNEDFDQFLAKYFAQL